MTSILAPTDCRVCAAMRERLGSFLLAGVMAAGEGAAWLVLAALLWLGLATPVYLGMTIALALGLQLSRRRLLSGLAAWLDTRLTDGLVVRAVQGKFQGLNYGPELGVDLERLRAFVAGPTATSLYTLVWTPLAIAAAFVVDLRAGIAAAAAAALLAGLLFLCERTSRKTRYEVDTRAMLQRQLLGSAYRAAEDIEAMGMMGSVLERIGAQRSDALAHLKRRERSLAILTLCARAIAAALAAALLLIADGRLGSDAGPGPWLAALLLAALVGLPFVQAAERWEEIGDYRETLTRLKAFAMSPPFKGESAPPPRTGGDLLVRNLSYGVAAGAAVILRELSFDLPQGQSLAIVGPSGAGKSVLARLLAGLAAPAGGGVELGGVPAFLLAGSADSPIGYVRQDVQLFDTDIAENIARLGTPDMAAVASAAMLAGVHEDVMKLPGGYRAMVGTDGEKLPAGMRQRIAIARALYGDPALLILDEPNAWQDNDGELALLRMLAVLKQRGTSVVLVTQRPAVVQHVDRLMVLEQGRIVAVGPRQQVLATLAARAA